LADDFGAAVTIDGHGRSIQRRRLMQVRTVALAAALGRLAECGRVTRSMGASEGARTITAVTDQEQVDALYAVEGFDHDLEAELHNARVLGVRPFDAERVHVSKTYELVLFGRRGFYEAVPDQVSAAAFFDALIGQQDRDKGNVLWYEERQVIYLIDHSFSFARRGGRHGASDLVQWRWSRGSRHLPEPAGRDDDHVRRQRGGVGARTGGLVPDAVPVRPCRRGHESASRRRGRACERPRARLPLMPRTAASELTARVVGQEVRRARAAAGLTQAEVAARLETSPTYVTNVEAGRLNLTLGQLTRIAAAIGADLQVSMPLVTIEPARVAEPVGAR
jgi:DNA-binding XRE family transcriptional regulator